MNAIHGPFRALLFDVGGEPHIDTPWPDTPVATVMFQMPVEDIRKLASFMYKKIEIKLSVKSHKEEEGT